MESRTATVGDPLRAVGNPGDAAIAGNQSLAVVGRIESPRRHRAGSVGAGCLSPGTRRGALGAAWTGRTCRRGKTPPSCLPKPGAGNAADGDAFRHCRATDGRPPGNSGAVDPASGGVT